MKHTIEELLLAAALRPLASQLREAARKKAKDAAGLAWRESESLPRIPYTQEERELADRIDEDRQKIARTGATFEAQWNNEHPIEEFVPAALADLEKIAGAINPS